MANFIESDKEKINCAYKTILLNLKDYLRYYDIKDAIKSKKIIFKL